MQKKLFIPLVLFLVFLTTYNIVRYANRERFDQLGSHVSHSPDGNFVIYMESPEAFEDTYCKIYLFDTEIYPSLSVDGYTFPTKYQRNNPRALYCIPVEFRARSTNFKWNQKNNKVSFSQDFTQNKDFLRYEIDLENFGLSKK